MPKSLLSLQSSLLETVNALPQVKAKGSQYLGALKKRGASPDEIEWTGLGDWLDGNESVITRKSLADFVATNGVLVTEQSLTQAEGLTIYSSMTLPGGKNYRELLLSLPERSPINYNINDLKNLGPEKYDFDGHDLFWPVEAPDQVYIIPKSKCSTPEDALNYVVENKHVTPSDDVNFQSTHFLTKNLLAHVRLSTFEEQGKRTLVVEEIQSDWHQQGRRFGYNYIGAGKLSPREAELLGLRDATFSAEHISDQDVQKSERLELEVGASLNFKTKKNSVMAVPDAPFKNNRWLKLALKRVLRMAAEEGFDEISWAPGSIQIERSSSGRSIDKAKLTYTIQHDGNAVWMFFGGSKIGPYELLGSDLSTSDIKNKIGPELFNQALLEIKDKRAGYSGTIQMDNIKLKLENRGVATFYDTILPNTLTSIVKGLDPDACIKKSTLNSKTETGTIYTGSALRNIQEYILLSDHVDDQSLQGRSRSELRSLVQNVLDKVLSNFSSENSEISSDNLNEIFGVMGLPSIESLGFSIYGGDPIYNDAVVETQSMAITSTLREKALNSLTLFQFAGPQSETSNQFTLDNAKARLEILDKAIADVLKLDFKAISTSVNGSSTREYAGEFFRDAVTRFNRMSISLSQDKDDVYCAEIDGEILYESDSLSNIESYLSTQRIILDAAIRLGRENFPDDIRKDTGWFIGADNRWRYEISDHEAIFKPIDGLFEFTDFNDRYVALADPDQLRVDAYSGDMPDDPASQAERDALWLELDLPINKSNKTFALGDLISHDKLFAAYPDLRKITVSLNHSPNCLQLSGALEQYQSGKKVIDILGNFTETSPDELMALVGHEIQHAIQSIENFARGGSVDSFEESAEYLEVDSEYRIYGAATTAYNRVEFLGESIFDASRYIVKHNDGVGLDLLVGILGRESRDEVYVRYQQLGALRKRLSPHAQYKALLGEVEARLTQGDTKLAQAERLNRNPITNYDTPEEEIMVRFNDGTMACEAMSNIKSAHENQNRAAVKFRCQNFASIFLGKDSDPSSAIHEGAHVYLELYNDIVNLPTSSASIRDDFSIILDWFGVSKNQWDHLPQKRKIELHEQFAESFEQYIAEGVSPNQEMNSEFRKFEGWMGDVYGNAEAALQNSKLNDDIRSVFDRMIASGKEASIVSETVRVKSETQLITAGSSPEVAKAQSAIFSAAYSSFAERAGLSHQVFLDRYDFSINHTNKVPISSKHPESGHKNNAAPAAFKGNNPGEAIEWYLAKTKGLDLNYEPRKKRADAQGFDTSRVAYYDKEIGFNGIVNDAANSDDLYVFSSSARVAAEALEARTGSKFNNKPNPSYLKMGNALVVDNAFLDKLSERRFPANGHTAHSFSYEYMQRIREWAKEGGYDSVIVRDESRANLERFPEEARIIFSADRARSIHSAYDPAPGKAHVIAAQSFVDTYGTHDSPTSVPSHIDTRTVWYHGSPIKTQFNALRESTGGELGKGIYVTQNYKLAENYALPRGEVTSIDHAQSQAGVIELHGPKLKDMTKAEFLSDRRKYYHSEQVANGGKWDMSVAARAEDAQQKSIIKDGYGGINIPEENQAVIFDPDDAIRLDAASKMPVVNNILSDGSRNAADRLGRAFVMGYDTIVYRASGNNLQEHKPSIHQAASYFALTPEKAIRGTLAGKNDGSGAGSELVQQVMIPSHEIYGLKLTPKEMAVMAQFTEPYVDHEIDKILTQLPERKWSDLFTKHSDDGENYYYHEKESITIDYAAQNGIDVYGHEISSYGGKGDFHNVDGVRVNGEQLRAIIAKKTGMSGFLQLDEAGLSIAMVKLERVRPINTKLELESIDSTNMLSKITNNGDYESGPWFHSSDEVFNEFAETSDIGFHFGSENAASDRRARTSTPEVEIDFASPSSLAIESLRVFHNNLGSSPQEQLFDLIIQKSSNPRANIKAIIDELSLEDIQNTFNEYAGKETTPEFIRRVNEAIRGNHYKISLDGKVLGTSENKEGANTLKASIENQLSSPFKVMLRASSPIKLPDLRVWSAISIAIAADFNESEMSIVQSASDREEQYRKVTSILKSKGFDSISYTNEVEDPGSQSVIVFDNEQILKLSRGELIYGADNVSSITTLNQSAFHGSAHGFKSFSLDHLSTGEGVQAFGWGLYFSDQDSICKWYRDKLSAAQGVSIESDTICLTAIGTFNKALNSAGDIIPIEEVPRASIAAAKAFTFAVREDQDDWKYRALTHIKTLDDEYSVEEIELASQLIRDNKVDLAAQRYLYNVSIPENYELLNYNANFQSQGHIIRDVILQKMKVIRAEYELEHDAATRDYEARHSNRNDFVVSSFTTGEAIAVNLTLKEADKLCIENHDYGFLDDTPFRHPAVSDQFHAFDEFIRGDIDAGEFYEELSGALGGDQNASLLLNEMGVPGLRYEAGTLSNIDTEGTNFVLWNEEVITLNDVTKESLEFDRPSDLTFNQVAQHTESNFKGSFVEFLHSLDLNIKTMREDSVPDLLYQAASDLEGRSKEFYNWFRMERPEFHNRETKDLLGQLSSLFPDTEFGSWAGRHHIIFKREKIIKGIVNTTPDLIGLEVTNGDGRYGLVLPDASEPGRFRVSYYDKHSFSHHVTVDSPVEAVRDAVKNGLTEATKEPMMPKLAQTKDWAWGVEVATLRTQNIFPTGEYKSKWDSEYDDRSNSQSLILNQAAFHGTPHKFEKFSLTQVGNGEGNQAFGWGVYLASQKEVASFYQYNVSKAHATFDGKRASLIDDELPLCALDYCSEYGSPEAAIETLNSKIKSNSLFEDGSRLILIRDFIANNVERFDIRSANIYQVEIPEDETLINYEAPLNRQPEGVKNKIISSRRRLNEFLSSKHQLYTHDDYVIFGESEVINQYKDTRKLLRERLIAKDGGPIYAVPVNTPNGKVLIHGQHTKESALEAAKQWITRKVDDCMSISGGELYDLLAKGDLSIARPNDYMKASAALSHIGIPGLSYFDSDSRQGVGSSRNFVIWDEEKLAIEPNPITSEIIVNASAPKVEQATFNQSYAKTMTSPPYMTMTEEAIDKLIRDSVGNEEDFQGNPYTSRYVVRMPIDDFLHLTLIDALPPEQLMSDGPSSSRIGEALINQFKPSEVDSKYWSDYPYLHVRNDWDDTGKVCNHEGRHRAALLKQEGAFTIPVVIEVSNHAETMNQLGQETPLNSFKTLIGQFDSNRSAPAPKGFIAIDKNQQKIDALIGSASVPAHIMKANSTPQIVAQGPAEKQNRDALGMNARAHIQFGAEHFAKIMLGPNADVSSIVHEGAHLYLNIYDHLATGLNSTPEIRKDFDTILEWFNVTRRQWNLMTLTEKEYYHERFAETFEVYMADGLAPNQDMSEEFDKFGGWMSEVYGITANHRPMANLTPEIRAVFDRMLSNTTESPLSVEVRKIVQDDLSRSGIASDQAAVHSKLFSTAYNTLAAKAGISAEEFIERFSLSITSTGTSDARAHELLSKAQEVGYSGENMSEAAEWINASRSGLDMSDGARFRRAAQQGFEPVVWYHGSETAGFTKFDLTNSDTSRPDSIFMADNIQVASTYSRSNVTDVIYTAEEIFEDPAIVDDLEIVQTFCLVDDNGHVEYEFESNEDYAAQIELGIIDEERELELEPRFTVYTKGYTDIDNGTKEDTLAYLRNDFEQVKPGIYKLMAKTRNAFVAEIDWCGNSWDDAPTSPAWNFLDEEGAIIETAFNRGELTRIKKSYPQASIEEFEHRDYETTDDVARVGRDMGVDFIKIKNIIDDGPHGYGGEGTILIAFNENKVRSVDAAFDPNRTNDSYLLAQAAYHGTASTFDAFDLSNIGEGTGAAAYGWGHYFTENVRSAQEYSKRLAPSSRISINDRAISNSDYDELFNWASSNDLEESMNATSAMQKRMSESESTDDYLSSLNTLLNNPSVQVFERAYAALKTELVLANHVIESKALSITKEDEGNLYKVNIGKTELLLDYDRPLTQQNNKIAGNIEELCEMLGLEYSKVLPIYRAYEDGPGEFLIIDERTALTLPVGYQSMAEATAAADKLMSMRIDANRHHVLTGESLYESLASWIINRPDELSKLGVELSSSPDRNQKHLSYEAASKFLNTKGIKGLTYRFGSRGSDSETRNYVIWDDSVITIMENQQDQQVVFSQSAVDREFKALNRLGFIESNETMNRNSLNLYHCITPKGLQVSNDLFEGNLVSPSLALTNNMLSQFGEITLVANPDLLQKNEATIYDCDVASPRLPRPIPSIDKDKLAGLNKLIKSVVGDIGLPELSLRDIENTRSLNNIETNPLFAAYVMNEMGVNIDKKRHAIDQIQFQLIEHGKLVGFDNLLDDQYANEIIIEYFNVEIEKHLDDISAGPNSEMDREVVYHVYFDSSGMLNRNLAKELIDKCETIKLQGGLDLHSISSAISDLSMQPEIRGCITEMANTVLLDMANSYSFDTGKKDQNGDSVFLPYTASNLQDYMREKIQAGETLSFGPTKLRASHASTIDNIEDARSKIGKLKSNESLDEDFAESTRLTLSLIEELRPHYKGDQSSIFYTDQAIDALCLQPDEWHKHFNMNTDMLKKTKAFIYDLTLKPTEYFEVKLDAQINISDFEAAIVPNTIDLETVKLLLKYGIPIYYDNNREINDRLNIVNRISQKINTNSLKPTKLAEYNTTHPIKPIRVRDPDTNINITTLGSIVESFCKKSHFGINLTDKSSSLIVAEALRVNISQASEVVENDGQYSLSVDVGGNNLLIDSNGLTSAAGSELKLNNCVLSDTPKDSSISYKLSLAIRDLEINEHLNKVLVEGDLASQVNDQHTSIHELGRRNDLQYCGNGNTF